MIDRWITNKLEQTLMRVPAVALLGARQVGKTTLAQTIAQGRASIYVELRLPECA